MGLISGISLEDSVKLANIAAGAVIVKRGTVAISQKELIESVDEGKDC
jgi:D-beta-D-heptose 7-phosphate kinase/D-beta-D-heptose 1-phosphate adenosyltransferase